MSSTRRIRTKGRVVAESLGDEDNLIASWFLGPKAENSKFFSDLLQQIFQDYAHWRGNYKPSDLRLPNPDFLQVNQAWKNRFQGELGWLLGELKAHFPFYSPRYIAHMLSEQTVASMLGYFAGMLYNPNNVTDEAAPVTVDLELE